MSKKAINQAIKNVKLAGLFAAESKEAHERHYPTVKKNADALSILGIMDWITAFDMLFAEFNKEIKDTTELRKEIELIKTARI